MYESRGGRQVLEFLIQIKGISAFLQYFHKRKLGEVICFAIAVRIFEGYLAGCGDEVAESRFDPVLLFHLADGSLPCPPAVFEPDICMIRRPPSEKVVPISSRKSVAAGKLVGVLGHLGK